MRTDASIRDPQESNVVSFVASMTHSPSTNLLRASLLAVLTCVAFLALTSATAAAAGEETHVFNAELSLTGDCAVSTVDTVPDPGCPGGDHPSERFVKPNAVAVDRFGNRYVGSYGGEFEGAESRIDVFSPLGKFLTEIDGPEAITNLAVDSAGNLYAGSEGGFVNIYHPNKYDTDAEEIEYGSPPTHPTGTPFFKPALAINPANDHLLVGENQGVREYSSAAEGSEFLDRIVSSGQSYSQVGTLYQGYQALAVDGARQRLLVAHESPDKRYTVLVFDLTARSVEKLPYGEPELELFVERTRLELLFVIDGSATPQGKFSSNAAKLGVAVDEETGHVFVGDLEASKKAVYEFDEDGNPVSTMEHSFTNVGTLPTMEQLAVDNGPTSPARGVVFVPSGASPGHSYAFERKPPTKPPLVEAVSVDGITGDEAVLHGKVNPGGIETDYRIEYTTQQRFELEGFEGADVAGEGTLDAAVESLPVEGPAIALNAGTAYRFRIVAISEAGADDAEASFATYTAPVIPGSCPNQTLRTGASANLPDCRAYELVTPADTNGHPPYGQESVGPRFASRLSSPDGNALSFGALGGIIPGTDATGSLNGDSYLAKRGIGGWHTENSGPSGAFSTTILSGTMSEDQGYRFWDAVNAFNPAHLDGVDTGYLRYPDNHSELLGQGSLGRDANALGRFISPGGGHVIFATGAREGSPVQLEPDAPPSGTRAVYDRTPDGVTHVISLLPGDIPLGAKQNGLYVGASIDGSAVAFTVGSTLYVRYQNSQTFEIGDVNFAGFGNSPNRLFYVELGDLYAYDFPSENRTAFTQSGDVTVVNISRDGSTAYFVSPQALSVEANPHGRLPEAGERNLYASRGGAISFVGVVTERDVVGINDVTGNYDGLGVWLDALAPNANGKLADDPSRTTPDGDVLVFQSRAQLTSFDSEGSVQVYRFDLAGGTLRCVSCNPTGISTGQAELESLKLPEHLSDWDAVNNVTADGQRVFFESTEALVLGDSDGRQDVYEWEEEGTGTCQTPNGCLYLISSGSSGRDDYLFAVSDSGNDVFLKTSDLLVPAFDPDETFSIYDARVDGGFPLPEGLRGECLGEACQPAASAPSDATPASATFQGQGNVPKSTLKCPRGKRKVRKGGKERCVPKHRHRAKRHKADHAKKRFGAKGRSHR